jgi:hypothetical protein
MVVRAIAVNQVATTAMIAITILNAKPELNAKLELNTKPKPHAEPKLNSDDTTFHKPMLIWSAFLLQILKRSGQS